MHLKTQFDCCYSAKKKDCCCPFREYKIRHTTGFSLPLVLEQPKCLYAIQIFLKQPAFPHSAVPVCGLRATLWNNPHFCILKPWWYNHNPFECFERKINFKRIEFFSFCVLLVCSHKIHKQDVILRTSCSGLQIRPPGISGSARSGCKISLLIVKIVTQGTSAF